MSVSWLNGDKSRFQHYMINNDFYTQLDFFDVC